MRTALIADIHGNCVALDAVLADLRDAGIEQFVCLGDAIQGGPQPAETVARLRELGCPVVMGNADAWLLSGIDTAEPATEELSRVREWSLARLSPADRAFIGGFVPTVERSLGAGATLLAFHGSPHSFDDIIFPDTPDNEVTRVLGGSTARILAGGHTHVQQLRRLNGSRFVNPGSIGRAYDARAEPGPPRTDPWAEYAILTTDDDGRLSIEFRHVPYDVERLLAIARASGIPSVAAIVASYGRV